MNTLPALRALPGFAAILFATLFLYSCSGEKKATSAETSRETGFSDRLKADEAARKARVKAYAEKHGVPIEGVDAKGNAVFLYDVDSNGKPVYYKTK